jgi:serine/threonine protein phosphatase 1
MEDQVDAWLQWHSLTGAEVRLCLGKMVVCGHTGLKNGLPAYTDGFVCIDTKAYAGGWLTCLDVEDNLIWQANQQGQFRGPTPLQELGLPFSEASF